MELAKYKKTLFVQIKQLKMALFVLVLFLPTSLKADLASALQNFKAGNIIEAVREWENLASFGDSDAFYNLGQVYRLGIGRPSDANRSIYFYRRAAESGHPQAQGNLAVLHYYGLGTPVNKGEGIQWWRSAARRGHGQSQLALAVLYYQGDGLPQDFIQAYGWVVLAANSGVERAIELKSQMANSITPNQVIQGEILAKGLVDPTLQLRAPQMVIANRAEGLPQMEAKKIEMPRIVEDDSLPQADTQQKISTTSEPEIASPPIKETVKPQPQTPKPVIAKPSPADHKYLIQLGAFKDRTRAEALRDKLIKENGVLISHLSPLIMEIDLGADKGMFYRLRFSGFLNKAEGDKICTDFKEVGQVCSVVVK